MYDQKDKSSHPRRRVRLSAKLLAENHRSPELYLQPQEAELVTQLIITILTDSISRSEPAMLQDYKGRLEELDRRLHELRVSL